MPSQPIRVVLADDHPVVRHGLRSLLESLGGYDIVGEAADGEAAVREVVLTRPDVVLLDLRMPTLDGIEATRRIRLAAPGTAVLVLTMSDDPTTVSGALRAGANGYLLKGAGQAEIDRALHAVVAGEAILGSGVPTTALAGAVGPGPGTAFPELTERETAILRLIAQGLRNAGIAAELSLSPKTVANHISSIFSKLGISSRAQAMILARERETAAR